MVDSAKEKSENDLFPGTVRRDHTQTARKTFSYPDYTVGSGIAPDHALANARGL